MEPEYEKIAALEADLILDVKSSGEQERYDRLSQIAPTVGVPKGGDAYLASVDTQIEMIAAALGKEDEAEKLLEGGDAKFAEAAETHPEFEGKTITVGAHTLEGWGAYISESDRVKFVEKLGFTPNPAIEEMEPDGFSADISEGNLGVLDSDLLVIFPIYVPAADVTDNELFQQIPAVQDGRSIVFTDEQEDISLAYSLNSVLSIPYAIDKVVPLAAEALS